MIGTTPGTSDAKSGVMESFFKRIATSATMQEYRIMVKEYALQNNLPRLRSLLHEMRSKNLSPDTITLNHIIRAEIKAGNLSAAMDLFYDMRGVDRGGSGGSSSGRRTGFMGGAAPNGYTYAMVIRANVAAAGGSKVRGEGGAGGEGGEGKGEIKLDSNDRLVIARRLLSMMQSDGLTPTIQIWNAVMLGYFRRGYYREVLRLFDEMRYRVSASSAKERRHRFGEGGSMGTGLSIGAVNNLETTNVCIPTPSSAASAASNERATIGTYRLALASHIHAGDLPSAKSLFYEMYNSPGLGPSA
ncbi:hypothetical protein HK102_011423, partial [Quaeritorhiza haematococci]